MKDRQEKKAQFEQKKKRGIFPWIAVALAVVAAAAGVVGWTSVGSGGGFQTVTAENGMVSIPLAQVADGKAHFFSFRQGETRIDFFLLKSNDGVLRAALDTCDVCYRERKGYRQQGDFMVCNNCDQQFRSDRINEVKGGCNPAPIERSIAGDRVVIAAADLAKGAWYFQEQAK